MVPARKWFRLFIRMADVATVENSRVANKRACTWQLSAYVINAVLLQDSSRERAEVIAFFLLVR